MVNKNLFLHDLAVVAIMKNEGHYLKEWLDYHLLAGVDHFYLYDNDSPDNQAEVAAPYVKAGFVDYFRAPGKLAMYPAYNDAVKNFKFQCRYMAFIDLDEFIYPKSSRGGQVIDIVDEIFSLDPNAAGLAMNWQIFGSNGEERAERSRSVLERFTRRAQKDWKIFPTKEDFAFYGNIHLKTIHNPRLISYINSPHYANYFEGNYSISEIGEKLPRRNFHPSINPEISVEKIAVNHYYTKSKEEYLTKKMPGGSSCLVENTYTIKDFEIHDRNEVFDDGILIYRDERVKNFRMPDKSRADERLLNALMKNLAPILLPNTPEEFYSDKMETFLTCRAVSSYLRPRITNEAQAIFFEETSLVAILRTLESGASFTELQLFLRDLPNFLHLHYPVVGELRKISLQVISQMMDIMRVNSMWKNYVELDYLRQLLKE